ncbi:hypothetical protein P775_25225 [Puniceibacterium antarcticum]|uniref:Uncharacterized protein n=1 Tax=Puniceibacterium antarcticum TaxID=1206336 RepID=A0A2G8R3Y8_9RHOB|nr:hypothetical protein P775_25225 [Puniceibacterium antarcticum]
MGFSPQYARLRRGAKADFDRPAQVDAEFQRESASLLKGAASSPPE